MHLEEQQCNEFFDAMDSLLNYVNRRFAVIPHFNMEINTALDEAKAAIIARTLWENRAVIHDFCEANPDHLPSSLIQQVRLWEDALTGGFTVIRYHDGRALIMNEAGVFALFGVTIDIDQVIGPAPAHIEATILPFAGSIVYDGFLQAFDPENEAEVRAVQDEFEMRVAKEGVISTPEQFAPIAHAYNEKRLSDDMDALLEDILRESEKKDAVETLPEGFHRGALAQPGARVQYEKSQQVKSFRELRKGDQVRIVNSYRLTQVIKVAQMPEGTFESCLLTLTRGDLAEIARSLGSDDVRGNARKSDIACVAQEWIIKTPVALENALRMCSQPAFETAMRLYRGESIEFNADSVIDNLDVQAIVPFTFVFYAKGAYRAIMPAEIKEMISQLDLNLVLYARSQIVLIARLASSAVLYYGVVPLSEVYRQYAALYEHHVDESIFRSVFERELSQGDFTFALWTYREMDYLIHYTLTEDYVAHQMARAHFERLASSFEKPSESGASVVNESIDNVFDNATNRLEIELKNLETVRESILVQHEELAIRPLSREDIENDPMARLWEEPSVKSLLSFLDAHVPDGQDDYDFADSVVEEILYASIEIADVHAILKFIEAMGMNACSSDKETLPRLIANVFNIVPSWDNYGWSAKELMEQITGRKIFLTPEGDMMKIGLDDLCPCGSGKKYRDCHGR